MQTVDVVVVGAGPTGENVADRVVRGGLTAAVVEAELVGGECSYWACIPSKALLRPVHALRAAQRLPGVREAVTGPLDAAAVLARRDEFVHALDDAGQVAWLESAGIDLVRGHGRIVGERRVDVTTAAGEVVPLEARVAVVLATGTTARVPEVPGLREARPWTSREATSASAVPERLVILGGGVVGLEMAQAWRGLGSQVTLVDRNQALLGRLEPFAGELVAARLREDGVDLRMGASAELVRRDGTGGPVTVRLSTGEEITGDEVLVAAGRLPATTDVGLEVVSLEPGSSVPVDDSMRVPDVPWLYAAGDVNGRVLLTHQGKYQARVAGDAIVARSRGEEPDHVAEADHAMVPQVIFTDPEVASVGLTEAQAVERGLRVRVVTHDIGAVAGASLHADGYVGRAAMVVDEDRGVVVGATFVGQDVADLLHSATIAVVGEVPVRRLRHAVPSFPTISEVWLRLLEGYGL